MLKLLVTAVAGVSKSGILYHSAFGFITYQDNNNVHESSLYTLKKLTDNGKIIAQGVEPFLNIITEKYICW